MLVLYRETRTTLHTLQQRSRHIPRQKQMRLSHVTKQTGLLHYCCACRLRLTLSAHKQDLVCMFAQTQPNIRVPQPGRITTTAASVYQGKRQSCVHMIVHLLLRGRHRTATWTLTLELCSCRSAMFCAPSVYSTTSSRLLPPPSL